MTKVAVDTNIIIYEYDVQDVRKQRIAHDLLRLRPVVSMQIVSEYLNVMQKRRLPVSKVELMVMCIEWMQMCEFQPITQATLHTAQRLIGRYDLQIFDSIVAAAALEADCTILYTEDMHHGMTIDSILTIINPFE